MKPACLSRTGRKSRPPLSSPSTAFFAAARPHCPRTAAYIVLAALLASSLAAFGCTQQNASTSSKTLTVGVREAIPGFSNLNETTGKCTGLEVDIAEEMATRMGYGNVDFVTVHADDRESTLESGQVDCLVATMTITDQRLESMDFSPSYYEDETVLMVQTSSGLTKLEDLSGKTVGIVEGSSTKGLLDSAMSALQLESVTYTEKTLYTDLITLLETGEVDALCLDGCVAKAYLNSDRLLLPETLAQASYGVATNKDSDISEAVSSAIQSMLDDGTVAELIDKWN